MKQLEAIRSRAIAERSGFDLETAIVTPGGGERWVRITATIECAGERPTRLFGLKQDITEARQRSARTRYLAEFDQLTGSPTATSSRRGCTGHAAGMARMAGMAGMAAARCS